MRLIYTYSLYLNYLLKLLAFRNYVLHILKRKSFHLSCYKSEFFFVFVCKNVKIIPCMNNERKPIICVSPRRKAVSWQLTSTGKRTSSQTSFSIHFPISSFESTFLFVTSEFYLALASMSYFDHRTLAFTIYAKHPGSIV